MNNGQRNLCHFAAITRTGYGLTATVRNENEIVVTGTPTADGVKHFPIANLEVYNGAWADGIIAYPAGTYHFEATGIIKTGAAPTKIKGLGIEILCDTGNGQQTTLIGREQSSADFTVPSGVKKVVTRVASITETTATTTPLNETIKVSITQKPLYSINTGFAPPALSNAQLTTRMNSFIKSITVTATANSSGIIAIQFDFLHNVVIQVVCNYGGVATTFYKSTNPDTTTANNTLVIYSYRPDGVVLSGKATWTIYYFSTTSGVTIQNTSATNTIINPDAILSQPTISPMIENDRLITDIPEIEASHEETNIIRPEQADDYYDNFQEVPITFTE